MSMITIRDIADVAARALKTRNWKGVAVRELLGQRNLTYAEATRIIGQQIGKPDLKYVQFSYAETASPFRLAGFSEDFAGLPVELTRALNAGTITSREGGTPANSTAARAGDFAADLARAYEALMTVANGHGHG